MMGEGFAYFCWHRHTWKHNLCSGWNATRACRIQWSRGARCL